MLSRETLRDNIRRFYTRLEAAAVKSGRKLSDISVVAAIKSQPEEIINNLKSLGIDAVGDNRVQELIRRYNPGLGLKWHFIGQLQTNKVKYIIDKVDLIHSLDRLPLLEKLDKEALKSGKKVNALIEVNAGGEPNKGGIEPSGVIEFARLTADYPNVTIRGLMSVMPQADESRLEYLFNSIRDLYIKLKDMPHISADILSLGMSNDFELAVKCGSNMVRPGRVIFGERS
ncbi:MAG: YggS family pyridoxal phosphate-dependent enzyme [Christensenellales bacterium]|jgi:pyridoxal phosphate enzyme (YggS family)